MLEQAYQDPDLLLNQCKWLSTIKHNGDLQDYINKFELLCAQVGWPKAVKASMFLNSLQDGLRSKIQCSDVDLDDYEKVRLKAIHLDKKFQE
jgi:hypothetical protein